VRTIRPGAFQFYQEVPSEHLKLKNKTVSDTVKDYIKDPDLQESRKNIREVQKGGKFHGDLIAASQFILSETYDLYDTPGHARVSTVVEAELEKLKPDLLDSKNNVVVECGNVGGNERDTAFITKCLEYCYRLDRPADWMFIHVPKSLFDYGDESSSHLPKYTIRELRVSEGLNKFKQRFLDENRSDKKELAKTVSKIDEQHDL
jgi:hypothetical protein